MKWAWKLGEVVGIKLYMHATFGLLVLWVGSSHWFSEGNVASVLVGISFLFALFACVLLHELGHALMAKRFGIRTRDITLLPIGGIARLERMPDEPMQELQVALAGPAVNVVIAALLFAVAWLLGNVRAFSPAGLADSFVTRLLVVNVFLVVFNLLPAFPMDGGRVVRALLATRMPYARATRWAATLGQIMAVAFAALGFFLLGNPMLILIGLFVWVGAAQEARLAEVKSSLSGIPAERAMLTEFRTLSPDDNLGRAIELLLAGSQHDFPVVRNGEVVGVLRRPDLIAAVAARDPSTAVQEVMRRDFKVLEATDLLEPAFLKIQGSEFQTIPVLRFGRLVGVLTLDNLGEFMAIESACSRRANP